MRDDVSLRHISGFNLRYRQHGGNTGLRCFTRDLLKSQREMIRVAIRARLERQHHDIGRIDIEEGPGRSDWGNVWRHNCRDQRNIERETGPIPRNEIC